jgi:hypothetical protein
MGKKSSDNRSFSFVTHTAKIVARILRRRKERNLKINVEKMNLDIEEQKDAESDITTKFGHR